VKDVLNQIDKDGNGTIELREFITWYIASEQRIKAEVTTFYVHFYCNES